MRLMAEKVISILLVLVPLSSYAFLGAGDVVYDPSTWAQTVAIANNTMDQINQLRDTYDLSKSNLRSLIGIANYLKSNKEMLSSFKGKSDQSMLTDMNPDDPDYSEERDAVLSEYYERPEDPSSVRSKLSGVLDDAVLNRLTADAQQNKKGWVVVEDAVAETAHQTMIKNNRTNQIDRLSKQASNLGPESELQTQQLALTASILLLQQQEGIADLLRSIHSDQTSLDAQKRSAMNAVFKNEIDRLSRAAKQGSDLPDKQKWGKL